MAKSKNVRAIPATKEPYSLNEKDAPKKRKVAGYARVSTDHEEQQTSYEAQVSFYTEHIQSNPEWEFAGIYTDEGISATTTAKREGFKAMINDALDGKIDLILTKSVSRFARNTVDSLATIRTLKDHGVEVFFEKEQIWTFDAKGELMITIMSSLAQEESRSISENVRWGNRKKYETGKYSLTYSAFLGYDKGPDGELVINEEQAVLVRRIFSMALDGYTPENIAAILTKEGILTVKGKSKWHGSTIKSMLHNEKYKGDALLQKHYTSDFLTKKQKKNRGEVPQYYVAQDHEPIIDPETFDMVQLLLEHPKHRAHQSKHPFSGKIFCADCGQIYGPKSWPTRHKDRRIIWQCSRKYTGDTNCRTPRYDEKELKTLVTQGLNQEISTHQDALDTTASIIADILSTDTLKEEQQQLGLRIKELNRAIITAQQLDNRTTTQRSDNRNTTRSNHPSPADQAASLQHQLEDVHQRCQTLGQTCMDRQVRQSTALKFIEDIKTNHPCLTEFDEKTWTTLVDHIYIDHNGTLQMIFNDGTTLNLDSDQQPS